MLTANGIQIIFGGAAFLHSTPDEVAEWLKVLEELDFKIIDTAQAYGASEESLGKAGAAKKFTIDSKQLGAWGPVATKDVMIQAGEDSLQKLQADTLDVYYIHAPDRRLPFKDTLSGLDALHKRGAFKRLGLSNFLAQEVDEIVKVAKDNKFVVPSVYQGNYSAVARRTETEILPTLRKHNMAFYAYSPIAGGFLAKSKKELTGDGGRFADGKNPLSGVYNAMYNRPSFVEALGEWEKIAEDEGISRAELAYRWVIYHAQLRADAGDAVLVGARKKEQLRETVEAIKRGPLSEDAVERIERIWELVKGEASLDNYEMQNSK
ncbi:hypothetical protein N0V88_007746 [Collariella sp. IMI 366227]|nr:hypothetical protein N0V88_007746 [Collariella sp. IMI 366227]